MVSKLISKYIFKHYFHLSDDPRGRSNFLYQMQGWATVIMIHGFVLDLKINITVCGADEIASLVSRHELASRTFFECPFLRDYVSIVSSSLF